MAEVPAWDDLVAGRDCPLCSSRPKDAYFVRQLETCSLYLANNQVYRGQAAVVYDLKHVARVDQLFESEWRAFAEEIHAVQSAIQRVFSPDHINLESLGNSVPHLHFHFIPRYKSDKRWGYPIWTTRRGEMAVRLLDEDAYAEMAGALNREFEDVA